MWCRSTVSTRSCSNIQTPTIEHNRFLCLDKEWKDMRNILSPTFTSAKLKNMFLFVDKCANQAILHVEEKLEEQYKANHPSKITMIKRYKSCGVDNSDMDLSVKTRICAMLYQRLCVWISDANVYEVEMKSFFSKFASDVIATTAFGVEVDSFKDENNEFYRNGKEVITPGIKRIFSIFMLFASKWLFEVNSQLKANHYVQLNDCSLCILVPSTSVFPGRVNRIF